MKKINLILSDIDGTLLERGYKLSQNSLLVLKEFRKRNYFLIPVSAKTFIEIYYFCKINNTCTIDKDGFWGIVEIGGGLLLPNYVNSFLHKSYILYEDSILFPLTLYIHNFLPYVEKVVDMYCRNYVIIPSSQSRKSSNVLVESDKDRENMLSNWRLFDLLLKLPEDCEQLVSESLIKNGLTIVKGMKYIHVGYKLSKKRGIDILLKILEEMGYMIDETVCIGDSINDLEFIRHCGRKFTVNFHAGIPGFITLNTSPEMTLTLLYEHLKQ